MTPSLSGAAITSASGVNFSAPVTTPSITVPVNGWAPSSTRR